MAATTSGEGTPAELLASEPADAFAMAEGMVNLSIVVVARLTS